MIMIKLGNSEEEINNLAELISQDPTFPMRIRTEQKNLLLRKIIKQDEKYLKEQEEILKKAEKIGFANTGYIFDIHGEMNNDEKNKDYMVYKKIKNKMVCIEKKFEMSEDETIKGLDSLINYLKNTKIKKLITFDPADFDCFHTYPWYEGETDETFKHGRLAYHLETSFNKEELKKLKENGIAIHELPEKEAYDFSIRLESLV